MEIAIVDDEERACLDLAFLLRTYRQSRGKEAFSVHTFTSGSELLAWPHSFDLIFLDIQMPDPDGMRTAQELRRRRFAGDIVFTTVLSEYVFDAFGVEAADFLVKPIDPDRLAGVMDRLLGRRSRSGRIIIEQRTGTTVVSADEIECCEVRGRRLHLYLRDGRTVVFYGKLDSLAEQLDKRFFRCHRSYLINMDCVSNIADGQIQLQSRRKVSLAAAADGVPSDAPGLSQRKTQLMDTTWIDLIAVLAPGVLQLLFITQICAVRHRLGPAALYLAGLSALFLAGGVLGPADTLAQVVLLALISHFGLQISWPASWAGSLLAVALTWIPFGMLGSVLALLLPGTPSSLYPAVLLAGTAVSICSSAGAYAAAAKFLQLGSRQLLPQITLLIIPTLFLLGTEVVFARLFYSLAATTLTPQAASVHMALLVLQMIGLAALLATLAAYRRLLAATHAEVDLQTLELANKVQQAYVQEAGSRIRRTRALRHDWRNHLLTLQGLLARGADLQAKKYLAQLEDAVRDVSPVRHTGNEAVDILVAEKVRMAAESSIDIELRPFLLPDGSMDDFDLCVIFGNALDNAIAACRELGGHCRITVRGEMQGAVLALYFENPTIQTVLPPREQGLKTCGALLKSTPGPV